ncbi:hypothetical protein GIY56_13825 [Paracoccus sp. YIM 132242]|uniref:DUF3035 domain-containing protein n=1 Tax=Paracoccus lichenicola TaxID=2665644 RepID=A0A6L6HQA7_9RHOB|nr:hypothetical protein [Paracoccus lichenicola]MTE01364.1 hypothetical protein [Paracoccus lichenicola]
MKNALTLIACAALLSGCGDEPYPSLLPTDRILAEPVLPDHAPAATSPAAVDAEAEARAAALRRRADALRGPVIEPDALARMRPRD